MLVGGYSGFAQSSYKLEVNADNPNLISKYKHPEIVVDSVEAFLHASRIRSELQSKGYLLNHFYFNKTGFIIHQG